MIDFSLLIFSSKHFNLGDREEKMFLPMLKKFLKRVLFSNLQCTQCFRYDLINAVCILGSLCFLIGSENVTVNRVISRKHDSTNQILVPNYTEEQ